MRTVKYNNHVCILHGFGIIPIPTLDGITHVTSAIIEYENGDFDNVAVTRISSVKENEKSITPEVLPTDAGSGGTPGWQYYCKTGGK